ncbi:MAG: site-specific integrase [Rickettsiales bacterium]|nr:site-specific integrase [Rickettsiales bacterium]
MGTNKLNFTKSALDKLPVPLKNEPRRIYCDTCSKGLVLMITYGGTKTFYFCYRYNGHKKMIKIGGFPYTEVEDARERAFLFYKSVKNGKNPLEQVNQDNKIPTLSDFFNNYYMPNYARLFKKSSTCTRNIQTFDNYCDSIKHIKLSDISKNELNLLHKQIGASNGQYAANKCIRLLHHMFNIAIEKNYILINPATGIKLFPEKSRDRFLQPNELQLFLETLNDMPNSRMKHLILLLLFTGQRKSNICSLKWEHIDFYNKSLYLPDTKNKTPQTIPLTIQALTLLNEIKDGLTLKSPYVFPSPKSNTGHITEPKKFWEELLKSANIENLRIHDLRRTMGSYQAITGSSLQIIGKSLGHKSVQSTSIYARLDLNSVRDSMQRATDEMQKISRKQI